VLPLLALCLSEIFEGLTSQRSVQIHTIVPAATVTSEVELMFKPKWWLPYPVLPGDDYRNSA